MSRGLDRYVTRELSLLFLACFGLMLAAFVAVDSVSEISRQLVKIGIARYLHYLALRAAAFQIFVTPLAGLLAALLCFSRMSREGEVLGLEASGIERSRIARPGLLFGLALALLSGVGHEVFSVKANQESSLMLTALRDEAAVVFKGISSGPEVMPDGRERVMIAHSLELNRGRLNGVFLHFFYEGRRIQEWYAENAVWGPRGWTFRNVRKADFDTRQELASETVVGELYSVVDILGALPEPEGLIQDKKDHLSLNALASRLKALPRGEGNLEQERRALWLEISRRIALPFSSVVFSLLAIPLGFRGQSQSIGSCLAITVVAALVYYVANAFSLSLGDAGTLPVFLTPWLPNLIFALAGAIWLARER